MSGSSIEFLVTDFYKVNVRWGDIFIQLKTRPWLRPISLVLAINVATMTAAMMTGDSLSLVST
jgi:hypothetical protein